MQTKQLVLAHKMVVLVQVYQHLSRAGVNMYQHLLESGVNKNVSTTLKRTPCSGKKGLGLDRLGHHISQRQCT